jgi:hypothetical protein
MLQNGRESEGKNERKRYVGKESARKRTTSGFTVAPAACRLYAVSRPSAARDARNGTGNRDGNQSHEFKCKQNQDHDKPLSETV